MSELNLLNETPMATTQPAATAQANRPYSVSDPLNLDQLREAARGDLARGLLWLLTFAIGGVLAFVGLGRLDGTVITQSIFPSLIALAGTALGFYFGNSQSTKIADGAMNIDTKGGGGSGGGAGTRLPPLANAGPDQTVTIGSTVTLRGVSSATAGTYKWTLTTLPSGSQAVLTADTSTSPSFIADKPGIYVAQLVVNDGLASAPSSTSVTAA